MKNLSCVLIARQKDPRTDLGIQTLHDLTHLPERVDRRAVSVLYIAHQYQSREKDGEAREERTHVRLGLVVHDQTPAPLVEHAIKNLVENHLG